MSIIIAVLISLFSQMAPRGTRKAVEAPLDTPMGKSATRILDRVLGLSGAG